MRRPRRPGRDLDGSDENRPETTATGARPGAPTDRAGELAGTSWSLVRLQGRGLIEGTRITLNFPEDGVRGNAGCNSYGANRARTDGERIEVSPISATEMACDKVEGGIMSQEQRYLRALSGADSYRVGEDRLEIRNGAGETTLLFEEAG